MWRSQASPARTSYDEGAIDVHANTIIAIDSECPRAGAGDVEVALELSGKLRCAHREEWGGECRRGGARSVAWCTLCSEGQRPGTAGGITPHTHWGEGVCNPQPAQVVAKVQGECAWCVCWGGGVGASRGGGLAGCSPHTGAQQLPCAPPPPPSRTSGGGAAGSAERCKVGKVVDASKPPPGSRACVCGGGGGGVGGVCRGVNPTRRVRAR